MVGMKMKNVETMQQIASTCFYLAKSSQLPLLLIISSVILESTFVTSNVSNDRVAISHSIAVNDTATTRSGVGSLFSTAADGQIAKVGALSDRQLFDSATSTGYSPPGKLFSTVAIGNGTDSVDSAVSSGLTEGCRSGHTPAVPNQVANTAAAAALSREDENEEDVRSDMANVTKKHGETWQYPRLLVRRAWRAQSNTGIYIHLHGSMASDEAHHCSMCPIEQLQLALAVDEVTERPCNCQQRWRRHRRSGEGRTSRCVWLFGSDYKHWSNQPDGLGKESENSTTSSASDETYKLRERSNDYGSVTLKNEIGEETVSGSLNSREEHLHESSPTDKYILLEVAGCYRATLCYTCSTSSDENNNNTVGTSAARRRTRTLFQVPGVQVDDWKLETAAHQLPGLPHTLEINLRPQISRYKSNTDSNLCVLSRTGTKFEYQVPLETPDSVLASPIDREVNISNGDKFDRSVDDSHSISVSAVTSTIADFADKYDNNSRASIEKGKMNISFFTSRRTEILTIGSRHSSRWSASSCGTSTPNKIVPNLTADHSRNQFIFKQIIVKLYRCSSRENRSRFFSAPDFRGDRRSTVSAAASSSCAITRWRASHSVLYSPVEGYRCVFTDENFTQIRPGLYKIEIHPAVRWICHGANNGCPRLHFFTQVLNMTSDLTPVSANYTRASTIDRTVAIALTTIVSALLAVSFISVHLWRHRRRYKLSHRMTVNGETCAPLAAAKVIRVHPLTAKQTSASDNLTNFQKISESHAGSRLHEAETSSHSVAASPGESANVVLLIHDSSAVSDIGNSDCHHRLQLRSVWSSMAATQWHVLDIQSARARDVILTSSMSRLWSQLGANSLVVVVVVCEKKDGGSGPHAHEHSSSFSRLVYKTAVNWLANSRWCNDYRRVFVVQLNSTPDDSSADEEAAVACLVPSCRFRWPNDQAHLMACMSTTKERRVNDTLQAE